MQRCLSTRRSIVAAVAAFIVAACSPATVPSVAERPPPPEPARPPNVLVIVMDTTRADRCSFIGSERETTPRLRAFARECLNFRNAWVPAGWTGPSHASLFTGLRPAHHGFLQPQSAFLASRMTTMAEILRAAQYRTALYSNNPIVSDDFGLAQGFGVAPRLWTARDRPLPHCRATHELSLEFIRAARADGVPFHVVINDFEAHLPYQPPASEQSRFVRGSPSASRIAAARAWDNPDVLGQILGLHRTPPETLALVPDLYDAEVAGLDAEIGSFLDTLRAEGILDDTLVVITSDHGENLGEHGLWDHRFSLHATIRHVPLLVRLPAAEGRGRVSDDIVRIEDVLPTVLAVCGLDAPTPLDGASLLAPDLSGRLSRASYGAQTLIRQTFQYAWRGQDAEHFDWEIRAVLDRSLHLIVRSDEHIELFDRATDPKETRNIAEERPLDVERLRARLDE